MSLPGREEPIQGISGEIDHKAAQQYGHKNVHYVADKKRVPAELLNIVQPNDIVITMGAGDIWKFGDEFLQQLKRKQK